MGISILNSTMIKPRFCLLFFLALQYYEVDGKKKKKMYIVHTKNMDNVTSELKSRRGDYYNSMYGCNCNGEADKSGKGGICTYNIFGNWCYVKKDMCEDEKPLEGKYYSFSACDGHVINRGTECPKLNVTGADYAGCNGVYAVSPQDTFKDEGRKHLPVYIKESGDNWKNVHGPCTMLFYIHGYGWSLGPKSKVG